MALFNYTTLTLTQLIEKIGKSRYWNLPVMLEEAFKKVQTKTDALTTQSEDLTDNVEDLEGRVEDLEALVVVPEPEPEGTFALQSIDGVLTWVEVV